MLLYLYIWTRKHIDIEHKNALGMRCLAGVESRSVTQLSMNPQRFLTKKKGEFRKVHLAL